MRRARWIAWVALAATLVAAGSARAAGFADRFASPARQYQPKFRWWWPNALVDTGEIKAELDQMADAGFGGAEIADVHHSATQPLDPTGHGWGTPAWTAAVQAALEEAKARGMTIDLTVGPAWPAAVPTITPDSPAAMKELAYGLVTVPAGQAFDGPAPAPVLAAASGVTEQKLLYVQAAKVLTAGNPPKTAYTLDGASVRTLPVAPDGTVSWTAPADGGTYVLISYWMRGSGQKPEGGPHTTPDSYVVDHLSRAGTSAITGFWDANILTPSVRSLLHEAGGALFEDSLELETKSTLWTPGFEDEFQRRMGYSLIPYLPLLARNAEKSVFNFDPATSTAVRRDVNVVLTDLYDENHLLPLRAWANALGLKLRVQPYGLQTDALQASALLDIPEGESLGFKNLDDYKREAGGRDMAGHVILSNEAGATAGGAYSTTWESELRKLAPMFTAGVNQNVFHGFSYATTPEARWPGFSAFSPLKGAPGYGESWGPRMPTWRHVPDIAGYFARNQEVMQSGVNRVDAAVLVQKGWVGAGYGAPFFTPDSREASQVLKDGGNPIGWTDETISEAILNLPSAVVRDRRLAPDGPAFKALVLEGDVTISRDTTLEISTARKLLDWAHAGLPIVVVGNWSAAHVPGLVGDDAELQGLVEQLLAQPTVRNVADRSGIPGALAELGVQRDVSYAVAPLLTAHRVDGAKDYYFLANNSATAAVDEDATFAMTDPTAVPYVADAWTGELTPVADYTVRDGRLSTRIRLKAGQTGILVFGHDLGALPVHATGSDADAVRTQGKSLVVRDTQAGTYATTLSDGRTVDTTIADVPAPQDLTHWHLDVDDWLPGATATQTVHAYHSLELDGLKAWPDIPELADSSGIGTYTTTVDLHGAWSGGHGAYLHLGEVFDTFRVTVNGRTLPPADQLDPVVDIGRYLHGGANTITVEVATTLNNRLRAEDPAYATTKRQPYGLVGPVRLIPYGEAHVDAD